MKVYIANLLLFFSLVTTSLLICSIFFITSSTRAVKTYSEMTYETIYIDRDFTVSEVEIIKNAAAEWHTATNGRVNYTISDTPPEFVSDYDPNHTLIISKVSNDNAEFIIMDKASKNRTLAFYFGKSDLPFIMVSNRTEDNAQLKGVILHEMGHALGLEHTYQPLTLMYPNVELGSDTITKKDVEQYCEVHHCSK